MQYVPKKFVVNEGNRTNAAEKPDGDNSKGHRVIDERVVDGNQNTGNKDDATDTLIEKIEADG